MSGARAPRGEPLPAFDAPRRSPYAWLRGLAPAIRHHLLTSGAALVRGLPVDGPDALARARAALGFAAHVPTETFTRRNDFGGGILSPIGWPADRILCPFQEGSFSTSFPAVVLTACLTPPDGGGEAHLSDTRRMADLLPAGLAARVRLGGWRLTRVFHDGFGLSWREAFSVADRAELDKVLEALGIASRRLATGALHTVRHRPGVIKHPATGEECWFNQLAFLNAGALEPDERAVMTAAFGQDLPADTFFGDGSPLPREDLAALQDAYDAVRIALPWRRGDLLVADNLIMAQGRSPLAGSPEFLVALCGEPLDDAAPGPRPSHLSVSRNATRT